MEASLKLLNQYVKVDDFSAQEIADQLTSIGHEVEGMLVFARGDKLVVGYVKEKVPHPDSDHLNICQVEVGNGVTQQIVCGAPNVAAGQKVIVALPGCDLGDGFKIKEAKIRGIESNGMICSIAELGIDQRLLREQDKAGIHVLDADAPVGEEALKYMGYDDTVLDIGLTPNRADCMAMIALAYEVGALLKRDVHVPEMKTLNELESDIEKMKAEGIATKADVLSVKVKVNEAEMTLTKVDDGLTLSRMLLCQLCGLDLSSTFTLADEKEEDLSPAAVPTHDIDINAVYENRPEIRSLELANRIYQQKIKLTRADYLPSIALIGGYMATNPSVFNSFEKKFKGMWNVGVTVSLPIWHWGEGMYKVKSAKSEARIAQYQLQDAKEKIELQVNQTAFQVNEAAKKLTMAEKNLEKANENLRYATLGFEEGVIPASNVLEAHTAWLSAQSEKIDAQIDVKLTEVYLKKAMGQLAIGN